MVSPWCERGDINDYILARTGDALLDAIKLELVCAFFQCLTLILMIDRARQRSSGTTIL